MKHSKVAIVLARCQKSKGGFGIRFECREQGIWFATWAFAIRDDIAKREKYEEIRLAGAFELDNSWPGCPYCESRSCFRCECGKVGCWDGETQSITCPWCGKKGEISGQIRELGASSDH